MVMEMDLSMLKKCRKKKKTDQNTTKVAPVKENNPVKENKLAADSAKLKEIRLKHGASSAEYQAAAQKVQKNNQKRAIADWDAKAMDDVTVVEQPPPPPSE
jgi:hypothetical protein